MRFKEKGEITHHRYGDYPQTGRGKDLVRESLALKGYTILGLGHGMHGQISKHAFES